MKYKRLVYFFIVTQIFFLAGAAAVSAQRNGGTPFIHNVTPMEYGAHSQNFTFAQDNRGVLYIGNFAGILEYDGALWRRIVTPQQLRISALALDGRGRLYAGGLAELGYLAPNESGILSFHNLMPQVQDSLFHFKEIRYLTGRDVGFLAVADSNILYYDGSNFILHELSGTVRYAGSAGERLYLQLSGQGLVQFAAGGIEPVPGGGRFTGIENIVAVIAGGDSLVIATDIGGLFIADTAGVRSWRTSADSQLQQSVLTCGLRLGNGAYAFGSVRSGVITIGPAGGPGLVVGKDNGLLSNFVNDLFIDASGRLWAALNNGLAVMNIPGTFTRFTAANGLNGEVTGLATHNNALYASTYRGIYRMNTTSGTFSEYRNFKTACWDVQSADGRLFAATSEGTFVLGERADKQLTSVFTFDLLASSVRPDTLYAGEIDGIRLLRKSGGRWTAAGKLGGVTYEVRSMAEDAQGMLWASNPSEKVIRIDPSGTQPARWFGEADGLPSDVGNRVNAVEGKIIVSSINGLYHYDQRTGRMERYRLLEQDTTGMGTWVNLIVEAPGGVWINSGDESGLLYYKKNSDASYDRVKAPFNPVENFIVWSIYPQENGLTWIGGPNGLLRYDALAPVQTKEGFGMLMRAVMVNQDSILFGGAFGSDDSVGLSMAQTGEQALLGSDMNTLVFSYAAPGYDVFGKKIYQYYLEGFDDNWSDWSSAVEKEYTNLSPGSYTFRVRALNIYGASSAPAEYGFSIATPWYAQWWAYIVYLLLLAGIIWFIVRARSEKLLREKRLLEEKIVERTEEISRQKDELEHQSNELEAKNDELEKINMIVKAINSEIQYINLYQSMIEKTSIIRGVEKSSALALDPKSETYRFRVTHGGDSDTVSMAELSLDDAEKVYLRDAEELYEDIFVDNNLEGDWSKTVEDMEPPKSRVVIVIRVEEAIEAFIILENFHRQNAFDERDLSLIKNLKEHLTSAIIKTKLLEDIQRALSELKEAQSRLVQSEKLASLGQLTAGIAHEIQNPLNFVNNFSEVSADLADELREILEEEKDKIDEENYEELEDITHMIEENLKKINTHGKRAESIVKGMLAHSRGKTGEMETADLNKMVEEYINLTYHGMRAQNKDFNVKLTQDFDDSIGKIRFVPQDLSRVVLNIANNGAYAVYERSKKEGGDYNPELTATTKKQGNDIIIKIRDNGTGMPESVKEKIFNPFFTTKPTGKGTGLGLSMSYDIVTQIHKGTLDVQSKEGEYTEFTITIPADL